MMIQNISPNDAKKLIDSTPDLKIIDVREKWEYEIVRLNNAELIPLTEFRNQATELNPDDNYLIYCHHGARSFSACKFLLRQGFKNLFNLDGGINAWQTSVEPELATY